MARHTFGGGAADFVASVGVSNVFAAQPLRLLTLWTAATGGSQVTDLLNSSSQPVTTVTTDAYGNVPPFSGPNDGTAVLYADAGGGARVALHATDTEARVAVLESTDAGQASQAALTAETNARTSADTAEAAARSTLAALEASDVASRMPLLATSAWTSGNLAVGVNTVDATAGNKAPSLPTPTAVGQLLSVEKTDSTSNTVTVSGTIRGSASSVQLVWQYESIVFEAESSNSWRPIAGHKTLAQLNGTFVPFTKYQTAESLGIPTDGTTDATAAINALPANTGIVWFTSAALCKGTVYVPNGVILKSVYGRTGTVLKASASGTYDSLNGQTYLACLGDSAGDFAFGTRIEGQLDLSSIANLGAVYARNIQEQSGLRDFLIINVDATRVVFVDGNNSKSPQNWSIERGEIYLTASPTASNIVGIDCDLNSNNFRTIENVTINSRSTDVGRAAIRLNGVSGGSVRDIHGEQFTDVLRIGDLHAVSAITAENIKGHSSVTNVVHICAPSDSTVNAGLDIKGISPFGATNALLDDEMTRTAASSSNGAGGYYRRGNGTVGTQAVETNLTGAGSPRIVGGAVFNTSGITINSIISLAKMTLGIKSVTLAANGAATFDASQGTVLQYILQANGTSSSITNPQTGVAGWQFVILAVKQDSSGSRTFVWPTTNVKYAGGSAPTTSTSPNHQDFVGLLWDGTNWFEVFRSLNVG